VVYEEYEAMVRIFLFCVPRVSKAEHLLGGTLQSTQFFEALNFTCLYLFYLTEQSADYFHSLIVSQCFSIP
jgi:hypothetical protein